MRRAIARPAARGSGAPLIERGFPATLLAAQHMP